MVTYKELTIYFYFSVSLTSFWPTNGRQPESFPFVICLLALEGEARNEFIICRDDELIIPSTLHGAEEASCPSLLLRIGFFFASIDCAWSTIYVSYILVAGRPGRVLAAPAGFFTNEYSEANKEDVISVRWRILKANTNDYGNYDPTPSLSKPPFKLIPN
ncbi:hypothetical protein Cni_G11671 [Canna indica]|uniref:Uncharacterized protein n=1 Tax=Canna indica TaxID=4628 RepID=A0AAQ3K6R8_9LILI|nr:hypothetical protein Cni_G11671 [Canna indica]